MRLPLAVIAAGLLLPAAASASTASVTEYQNRISGAYVSYEAAAGEANDLTVEGDEGSFVLIDPGAEIEAGAGCTPSGPHSVVCTSKYDFDEVRAGLGDEDDHFASAGPRFDVRGGPGDDVLAGGAGAGALFGDADDDVLEAGALGAVMNGGKGEDELIGSDGPDYLTGGPGADSMDGGGEGEYYGDMVIYEDRTEPVTIDLSTPGPAGAAGEGDTLANVERARSGQGADTITASGAGSTVLAGGGNDVIRGGPGPDALDGGDGDDSITGAGQNDRIFGEAGRDRLDGGAGSDFIAGHDYGPAEQDSVNCGEGNDTALLGVTPGPLLDVIEQNCRRVVAPAWPLADILHDYQGDPVRALRVSIGCKRRCVAGVTVYAHGRLAGRAQRAIKRGSRVTLTVPLSEEARDELVRSGTLRLRFSLAVRWGQRLRHRNAPTSYYLLLREPEPEPAR